MQKGSVAAIPILSLKYISILIFCPIVFGNMYRMALVECYFSIQIQLLLLIRLEWQVLCLWPDFFLPIRLLESRKCENIIPVKTF